MINQEQQPFPRYIVFDEVRKNNPIINILIIKITNHSKYISLSFLKKIVLICLVYYYLVENLLADIPSHVIHVSKKDVINIESLNVSGDFIQLNLTGSSKIDLSKIEYLSKFFIFHYKT